MKSGRVEEWKRSKIHWSEKEKEREVNISSNVKVTEQWEGVPASRLCVLLRPGKNLRMVGVGKRQEAAPRLESHGKIFHLTLSGLW